MTSDDGRTFGSRSVRGSGLRAGILALLATVVAAGGVIFAPQAPATAAPTTGTIQGVIALEGGVPFVRGMWILEVEIYDSAGNWLNYAPLGADGSYSISVPQGTYWARFHGAANAFVTWHPTSFYVGAGKTVTINMVLPVAGMISGTHPDDDSEFSQPSIYAMDANVPQWEGLYVYATHEEYGSLHYNVGPLPTGDYAMMFRSFSLPYVPGSFVDEWWENASDFASATPVHVIMGSTTTVNFERGMPTIPTIGSVTPGFSALGGGQELTVTGWDFTGATSVTFDGVPGTGLIVASDNSLKVTTPAHAAGPVPVVVTGPDGVSAPKDIQFSDDSVFAGVPAHVVDVWNFAPNTVKCYQVAGMAGVPEGADGVVLNVTASLPNNVGHVRVYPDYLNNGASPPPLVSTVNFEVNRDVANSTTIALPANGKACVYSVGGTMTRLILDVLGYTIPGSGIVLTTPEKLIDTRSQAWYHAGPINGPVQPMTDYTVQVGGVGSVPVDAAAVMVNITVVDTRSPGHLRMWASDEAMPDTSVVNYAPETKANSQIVALSADGKLTFRSFSWVPTSVSPVQVLIDVTGYIAAGSDFVATTPTTVVETRPAYTPVGLPAGALTQNTVYPLTLDTSVVPEGATAVVLNVTAVQPTNFGHIRVYPDTNGLGTTTPPVMSNLNFIPGRDIPNMVIVQLPADRTIDFWTAYAGSGSTNLKVDLIGYIAAPPT